MKYRKYIITALISIIILSFVFIIKGIFPFGNNFAIWSDMHEQITAMYYHFWDSIRGNSSLFVDFSSGGGINFLGVLGNYILSPFTLIILAFPRDLVAHSTSIIIALKIVLSSITALYCLDTFYKRLPDSYKILLALLYAFCGYVLINYVITSWMDAVYLLPLLAVGLKKVLNLESTKMYIIILTISLVVSFYITSLILLYVMLASLLYIYFYKEKKLRKRIVVNLGISTFISLLCASFILLPTFLQLSESARMGIDLNSIMTSGTGPLTDKISYFFISGITLSILLLLLFRKDIENKDKLFITILLGLLAIPIIVEPINRLLHLGSYTGFPYRYGIISFLILMLVGGFYFNSLPTVKNNKIKQIITIIITSLGSITLIAITKIFYSDIQYAIQKLTLTNNTIALSALFIMFIITFIVALIILLLNKNKNKFTAIMLSILAITNITTMSSLYIGIDYDNERLQNDYRQMIELSKINSDHFYMKRNSSIMISNFGMVSQFRTFCNFSSLINNNNWQTMQRLGYDSFAMDTQSIGGNLFIDTVLGKRYLISDVRIENDYYDFVRNIKDLYLYEMNNNISFGYLIHEIPQDIRVRNSFEFSNIIYNSITNRNNIFEIHENFEFHNVRIKYPTYLYTKMHLTKENDGIGYLQKTIDVEGRKEIYLELFYGFDFREKVRNYQSFKISINDEYLRNKNNDPILYPNRNRNGVLNLGTFQDEEVTIRLYLQKDTRIKNIALGILDLEKYDYFVSNYGINPDINFNRNKINITINVDEERILFLPITYLNGYRLTNNNVPGELFRVYDNFIGIKLNAGENNIEITYIPPGFKLGIILTVIGIFLAILWIKKLSTINFKILSATIYPMYVGMVIILIIGIYFIPLMYFFKSFVL